MRRLNRQDSIVSYSPSLFFNYIILGQRPISDLLFIHYFIIMPFVIELKEHIGIAVPQDLIAQIYPHLGSVVRHMGTDERCQILLRIDRLADGQPARPVLFLDIDRDQWPAVDRKSLLRQFRGGIILTMRQM